MHTNGFSKNQKPVNRWYCWWPEVELNHRHTDFKSKTPQYPQLIQFDFTVDIGIIDIELDVQCGYRYY